MSAIYIFISLCVLLPCGLANTKPHIIFILADDLGWHDVGYHDSIIQTPNIDRLAAEGVKLENYYVTPLCSPSRSELMTGRYQIHTGMQHHVLVAQEPRCLPLKEVLMPQKLKESGYSTHMVGKWHLGFCHWNCTPNHRGFDTFFGFYLAGGDYFHHTRKCHGHRYECFDLRDGDINVAPDYRDQYSTTLFAEKSQEIIRKHDLDTPLFLYLSFQAVHAPLQVPTQYVTMYKDKIKDWDRRTYAAMTTCMDEAIGNVTKTLKEKGLLENSVIVFSTDNGGALNAGASNWPLKGQKTSLYEGGVRGAAFVWSPHLKPHVKGRVNKELLSIGDWLPTFIHLAGGSTNGTKRLDGRNQWDVISEGNPSNRKEVVHNLDPLRPLSPVYREDEPFHEFSDFDTRVFASIRVGNWKLVTGSAGDSDWTTPDEMGYHRESKMHPVVQLYNIPEDPEERSNLANARPDVVYQLLKRLQFHYERSVLPEDVVTHMDASDPVTHFDMAWTPWLTFK
ncbi:arylsulfatase B-like [Glandiceps talaboti]